MNTEPVDCIDLCHERVCVCGVRMCIFSNTDNLHTLNQNLLLIWDVEAPRINVVASSLNVIKS